MTRFAYHTITLVVLLMLSAGCRQEDNSQTPEPAELVICEGESGLYDNSTEDYGDYTIVDDGRPFNPWWAKEKKTLWRDDVETGELFTYGFLPVENNTKDCTVRSMVWDPDLNNAVMVLGPDDLSSSISDNVVFRMVFLAEDGGFEEYYVYGMQFGIDNGCKLFTAGIAKIYKRNMLIPLNVYVDENDDGYDNDDSLYTCVVLYGLDSKRVDDYVCEKYTRDDPSSVKSYYIVSYIDDEKIIATTGRGVSRLTLDGSREEIGICMYDDAGECIDVGNYDLIYSLQIFDDNSGYAGFGGHIYHVDYSDDDMLMKMKAISGPGAMNDCPFGNDSRGCPYDGMSFDTKAYYYPNQFFMTDVGVMFYEGSQADVFSIDEESQKLWKIAGDEEPYQRDIYYGGDGSPAIPGAIGSSFCDATTDGGDYLYLERSECAIRGVAGPMESVYEMYH